MKSADLKISILLIVYRMSRQAANTLKSLAPTFQTGVDGTEYEIVVVENNSDDELGEERALSLGRNIRYFHRVETSKSPVAAVNFAFLQSRAPVIGLMIDGARMITPGVLQNALAAFRMNPRAAVSVPSYHLGPDIQQKSMTAGYNPETEIELLEGIDWLNHGYRLFDISTITNACSRGVFANFTESNCVFFPRDIYERLGGCDQRFDLPGGGMVNLDFYRQLNLCEDLEFFVLPGEGSFHQFHGGVSTNIPREQQQDLVQDYRKNYQELRGETYQIAKRKTVMLGSISGPALKSIAQSAINEQRHFEGLKAQGKETEY